MKLYYYKELDGVRAIAALMVLIYHFFLGIHVNTTTLASIQKLSLIGKSGVSLFFVLSGFLITRILIKTKDNKNYFFNFYARRILRIFPLYYLFLILYYYVLPGIIHEPHATIRNQIPFWIYIQDFAMTFNWNYAGPLHTWSLAVEEHFYLFWPLLIYYLNPKRVFTVIIGILIISFLVRIIFIIDGIEILYFTFSRMDELALGSVYAILEINNKLNSKYSSKFLGLLLVSVIFTILLGFIYSGSGNKVIQSFKFLLQAFVYFSLIGYIITTTDKNVLKRIMKTKPMTYTGKISYGLYVYHPVCFSLFLLYSRTNSMILNFLGCVTLSYFIAALSYHLFEVKFLRLKKYFQDHGRNKLALAGEPSHGS